VIDLLSDFATDDTMCAMPHSKVLQARLTADKSIDVTVELSHVEEGERVLVQTTVTQADGAIAAATALVTGAAPAGRQRATLTAVPRAGTFSHGGELVTFTQATSVWSTVLAPVAVGDPNAPIWAASDSEWDGAENADG
jgi:hypothetical protein